MARLREREREAPNSLYRIFEGKLFKRLRLTIFKNKDPL